MRNTDSVDRQRVTERKSKQRKSWGPRFWEHQELTVEVRTGVRVIQTEMWRQSRKNQVTSPRLPEGQHSSFCTTRAGCSKCRHGLAVWESLGNWLEVQTLRPCAELLNPKWGGAQQTVFLISISDESDAPWSSRTTAKVSDCILNGQSISLLLSLLSLNPLK